MRCIPASSPRLSSAPPSPDLRTLVFAPSPIPVGPSTPTAAAAAAKDQFSVTSPGKSEIDYLGESTKGDLNVNPDHMPPYGLFLFSLPLLQAIDYLLYEQLSLSIFFSLPQLTDGTDGCSS